MNGIFFAYLVGHLRVVFAPLTYGDFAITLQFHGDGVVQTHVDDAFQHVGQNIDLAKDLTLRVAASPSSCWFFLPMVKWLEAIICGVQECAFAWDNEGPEGGLRWFNHYDGTGRLRVTWEGARGGQPDTDETFRLDQAQMVSAFYGALRSLVASPGYDRLQVEPVTLGECVSLALAESDQAMFPQALAERGRREAAVLLDALLAYGYCGESSPRQPMPLLFFINASATRTSKPEDDERWIDARWDSWSISERKQDVQTRMYHWNAWYCGGERLSDLRSDRVEAWLAQAPSDCDAASR